MALVSEEEGMHYEGYCIRPPSEADSILLQVTVGCSHNKCTFCGTYREKRFRIKEAGIELSVTVLLGIGGREQSLRHARATGELLSAMDPNFVGALTVMLIPDTPLYEDYAQGKFVLPDERGMLRELREMITCTNLTRGYFFSNHASNYLPIKAKLPSGKQKALDMIDAALKGDVALRHKRRRLCRVPRRVVRRGEIDFRLPALMSLARQAGFVGTGVRDLGKTRDVSRINPIYANFPALNTNIYMKIPPSPLYQRGVRGDFHASLSPLRHGC